MSGVQKHRFVVVRNLPGIFVLYFFATFFTGFAAVAFFAAGALTAFFAGLLGTAPTFLGAAFALGEALAFVTAVFGAFGAGVLFFAGAAAFLAGAEEIGVSIRCDRLVSMSE